MKKYLSVAMFCLVAMGMLLTGCDSGGSSSDDNNHVPQISNLKAVDGPSSTSDRTYFSVGDTVYFMFTVHDEGLDVSKIEIEIKKDGVDFFEKEYPISGQPAAEAPLVVPHTFDTIGNYKIEIEVEDAKGNDSNKLTKAIVVETSAP